MLKGRHGFGWMIAAWVAIVVLLAAGIFLVGNLAQLFPPQSS